MVVLFCMEKSFVRSGRSILRICCPDEPTGRVEFKLLLGKLRKLSDKMNT